MNKMIVLLTILVFTLSVSTAQAQSVRTSTETKELTQTPEKEGYPIYAIGGVGQTESLYTNSTPAFAIGAEIPFTKAHIFAFQLYSYSYIGRIQSDSFEPDYYGFISLGNNYYSHVFFLSKLKCYTSNLENTFRISLNLAFKCLATSASENDLDFGIGASYKINKNLFTELYIRIIPGKYAFDGGSGSNSAPSLLMLNMYYNINRD